jgi:subtilase family serine protease
MSPAQIQSFYNLTSSYTHTTVNRKTVLGGGSGIIAIVDAYHYPNAVADFNVFSAQFGLPQETGTGAVLQVVYENYTQPHTNVGWAQEAALDIQWAHALAPSAKIILVEAQDSSYQHLLNAVTQAVALNPSQISMSWSGGESSAELGYDATFNVPGPIFFAASGDSGAGTGYPAASPYVVAVGGTSVQTSTNGNFKNETGWSGSGGGPSSVEPKPSWQQITALNAYTTRCIPDLAADADPYTGVSVYAPSSPTRSKWMVFGGTSVATPCVAAMVNLGGMTYTATDTTLPNSTATSSTTVTFLISVYGGLGSTSFRDITTGSNGFSCLNGWDFVTGVGSPQGTKF